MNTLLSAIFKFCTTKNLFKQYYSSLTIKFVYIIVKHFKTAANETAPLGQRKVALKKNQENTIKLCHANWLLTQIMFVSWYAWMFNVY